MNLTEASTLLMTLKYHLFHADADAAIKTTSELQEMIWTDLRRQNERKQKQRAKERKGGGKAN